MKGAEIGCIRSHYNVLSNTKTKYTLVLEDDFALCENFDEELKKAMDELPLDFNALWLGGRLIGKRWDYSDSLLKISGITGTYGYIIKSDFIPKVLSALAKENKLADYAMSSVFDNVFKTKKNLVKHRAGYSIIQGKDVSYKDLE